MEPAQKRAIAYVSLQKYRKLMSQLALKGKSFSEWVRDKVDEEIS
jgi:hypothetical protein